MTMLRKKRSKVYRQVPVIRSTPRNEPSSANEGLMGEPVLFVMVGIESEADVVRFM